MDYNSIETMIIGGYISLEYTFETPKRALVILVHLICRLRFYIKI